jgi:hypothetical protein
MKENVVDRSDAGTIRGTGASVHGKFWRRAAMASVGALCAGGLMLGFASTASASAFVTVQGNVSVYNSTNFASGTVLPLVLGPGDEVFTGCWGRGTDIGKGNVWYHVTEEIYNHLGALTATFHGWVYGGTTDDNVAFHSGALPLCGPRP